jgi:ligand-binding sensor domain-containing protein
MCEDPDGNIWYGTRGDGLIMYSPPNANHQGRFSHFTSEGLPRILSRRLWRQEGNLWIGTNSSGVCQLMVNRLLPIPINADYQAMI